MCVLEFAQVKCARVIVYLGSSDICISLLSGQNGFFFKVVLLFQKGEQSSLFPHPTIFFSECSLVFLLNLFRCWFLWECGTNYLFIYLSIFFQCILYCELFLKWKIMDSTKKNFGFHKMRLGCSRIPRASKWLLFLLQGLLDSRIVKGTLWIVHSGPYL